MQKRAFDLNFMHIIVSSEHGTTVKCLDKGYR